MATSFWTDVKIAAQAGALLFVKWGVVGLLAWLVYGGVLQDWIWLHQVHLNSAASAAQSQAKPPTP